MSSTACVDLANGTTTQTPCPQDPMTVPAYNILRSDQIGPGRDTSRTGQIIALGGRFNTGQTSSNNVVGGLAGGGTTWPMSPDGTVSENGIARIQPTLDSVGGCPKAAVEMRIRWDDNTGYVVQSGANNTSIAATNDPLYFDGSRVQMAFLANTFSLRDTAAQAISIMCEDWMLAADNKVLWQWHSPDNLPQSLSPYFALYVDNGILKIVIRSSTNTRPTNANSAAVTVWQGPASAYINKRIDFVMHHKRSPYTADNPYANVWIRTSDAGSTWQQIVDYPSPVGFDYAGYVADGISTANSTDYFIASLYQWHNGNIWDLNYTDRRMLWYDCRTWRNEPEASFANLAQSLDSVVCCA